MILDSSDDNWYIIWVVFKLIMSTCFLDNGHELDTNFDNGFQSVDDDLVMFRTLN